MTTLLKSLDEKYTKNDEMTLEKIVDKIHEYRLQIQKYAQFTESKKNELQEQN
jgi:hypothetical protein